jgi:hypothetical protein
VFSREALKTIAKGTLAAILAVACLFGASYYSDRYAASVEKPRVYEDEPRPVKIIHFPDMEVFQIETQRIGVTVDNNICYVDFADRIQPGHHCFPAIEEPTIP